MSRYYIEEEPELASSRARFNGEVYVFSTMFYSKLTEPPAGKPNTDEVRRMKGR